jgi:hypothetical protein
MKDQKDNTVIFNKRDQEYQILEKQKKETEKQIKELLKKNEQYDIKIQTEILNDSELESEISKIKSNYSWEKQLKEK